MKKIILPIILAAVILASCNNNKYATSGKGSYETDEVYYQPSDTYISDFALVDDEAQMADGEQATTSPSNSGDDYYSGDPGSSSQNGNVTNNYYGDVYQSPWGSGYGGGFGNYSYGTWNNWPGCQYNLGWNPWNGWYFSFNYGYNWGVNPYYNPYYSYGYGWYSPYYNPWYYNQWGYNTWYSPYNYNNPWFGYNNPYYGGYWGGNYWNDGDDFAGVIFGNRNPLATGTLENSTYGDDLFYTGRAVKPGSNDQSIILSSEAMAKPSVLQKPSTVSREANPAFIGMNSDNRPEDRSPVTFDSDNHEDYVNQSDKPSRDQQFSQPTVIPSTTSSVNSDRPRPTYITSNSPQVSGSNNLNERPSEPNNGNLSKPSRESREPMQQNNGSSLNREPARNNSTAPSMKMPPMTTPSREPAKQPERVNIPSGGNSPSRENRPSNPSISNDNQSRTPSINNNGNKNNGGNNGGGSRSGGGSIGGGGNSGGSRSGGGNSGGGSVSGPRRK